MTALSDTRPAPVFRSVRHVALIGWFVLLSTQSVTVVAGLAGVITLGTVFSNQDKLNATLRLSWPVLVVILIGLAGGALRVDVDAWAYFRDFTYLAKVPLILYVSLLVGRWIDDLDAVFRAIFQAAVLLAVFYLLSYIHHAGWDMSRRDLRITVGRGYYLIVFGLLVALFAPRALSAEGRVPVLQIALGVTVMAAAIIASTSRGMLICMPMFFLAALIFFARVPFRWVLVGLIGAVSALSLPPVTGLLSAALAHWDARMVNEMVATDFGSPMQIRDAFRSYEAHLAWRQFQGFDPLEKLFGQGFGALVYLTFPVELGATAATQQTYTAVPITHVSLTTALVKLGVLGSVFYMICLLPMVLPRAQARSRMHLLFNHTAILLCLFIIWTFQGLFSTLDLINIAVAVIGLTHALRRCPGPG